MKPVLIIYATREGHTRRISQHLGAILKLRGLEADILDAAHLPESFELSQYGAAIVAASVHAGRHEKEIVQFVKAQRARLQTLPSAFLSVSLTETTVEDPSAPEERRTRAANDVNDMVDKFLAETGWHPERIKPIAGALLYTQYGVIKRFIMKRISKQASGPTDTTQDYEFTDWEALDRFAEEFADEALAREKTIEVSGVAAYA